MGSFESLVPEFYYDLIARITPGALALVVLGQSADPSSLDRILAVGSALLLPLAVLSAYVVGFLLQAISSWVSRVVAALVRSLGRKSGEIELWRVDPWLTVRSAAPQLDASVLLKALAERTMMRSIMILAVLLVVLDAPMVRGVGGVGRISGIVFLIAVNWRAEVTARWTALRLEANAHEGA